MEAAEGTGVLKAAPGISADIDSLMRGASPFAVPSAASSDPSTERHVSMRAQGIDEVPVYNGVELSAPVGSTDQTFDSLVVRGASPLVNPTVVDTLRSPAGQQPLTLRALDHAGMTDVHGSAMAVAEPASFNAASAALASGVASSALAVVTDAATSTSGGPGAPVAQRLGSGSGTPGSTLNRTSGDTHAHGEGVVADPRVGGAAAEGQAADMVSMMQMLKHLVHQLDEDRRRTADQFRRMDDGLRQVWDRISRPRSPAAQPGPSVSLSPSTPSDAAGIAVQAGSATVAVAPLADIAVAVMPVQGQSMADVATASIEDTAVAAASSTSTAVAAVPVQSETAVAAAAASNTVTTVFKQSGIFAEALLLTGTAVAAVQPSFTSGTGQQPGVAGVVTGGMPTLVGGGSVSMRAIAAAVGVPDPPLGVGVAVGLNQPANARQDTCLVAVIPHSLAQRAAAVEEEGVGLGMQASTVHPQPAPPAIAPDRQEASPATTVAPLAVEAVPNELLISSPSVDPSMVLPYSRHSSLLVKAVLTQLGSDRAVHHLRCGGSMLAEAACIPSLELVASCDIDYAFWLGMAINAERCASNCVLCQLARAPHSLPASLVRMDVQSFVDPQSDMLVSSQCQCVQCEAGTGRIYTVMNDVTAWTWLEGLAVRVAAASAAPLVNRAFWEFSATGVNGFEAPSEALLLKRLYESVFGINGVCEPVKRLHDTEAIGDLTSQLKATRLAVEDLIRVMLCHRTHPLKLRVAAVNPSPSFEIGDTTKLFRLQPDKFVSGAVAPFSVVAKERKRSVLHCGAPGIGRRHSRPPDYPCRGRAAALIRRMQHYPSSGVDPPSIRGI